MRAIWTLARRELMVLFNQPTGYILLVVFLVVNNFLFFRQVYLTATASLRPMLDLMPWVFLFFVPAVTMRSLAEDARTGTLEVVLAQPVTELELVLGKYLGQVVFLCIALALTFPIPIGLSIGADMQVGVTIAQYVGTALFAVAFAGVGVWASSVTRNQITAFILSVAVLFPLILVGINPLLLGLPARLGGLVASLAVIPHFENIARGVIDLRDVVYFVTLTAVFLAFAYLAVMSRKLSRGGAARQRLRLGTILVTATAIVVNLFGRQIGGRLDLTPGKAFTLSEATKDLLTDLDDLVTIKLFVSRELPPEIALVKRDIADLLSDIRAAGKGRVRVVEVDPADDEDAQSEAQSLGIPPIQFNVIGQSELQVKEGFLGIAVLYADASETMPFVQRTQDLEYRLVSYVRSLTREQNPVVGLMDSRQPPGGLQTLRSELEGNYDVRTISATDSVPVPEEISVIIMAGSPLGLEDDHAERYHAYFRRGGAALVMASGMQVQPQQGMASPKPVAWNRILEPYGVSIRADMAYDLRSFERVSIPGSFGMRLLVEYPFWVRALSTQRSPVNRDIATVILPWTSSIDTSNAVPGTVTPLVTTSEAGGLEVGRAFVDPRRDTYPTEGLAAQLLAAMVNPLAADSVGENRGRIVVVGNDEFATDQYAGSAGAGLLFVLNAVDWLAQDDALISIRSKERRPPPLVFKSSTTRDFVKWGNVAGIPLILMMFASFHLVRRRQQTRQIYRRPAAETS